MFVVEAGVEKSQILLKYFGSGLILSDVMWIPANSTSLWVDWNISGFSANTELPTSVRRSIILHQCSSRSLSRCRISSRCAPFTGCLLIWHQICSCNHRLKIGNLVEPFCIEICQLGWWTLSGGDWAYIGEGCSNYFKHLWPFSKYCVVCSEWYERRTQYYGCLSLALLIERRQVDRSAWWSVMLSRNHHLITPAYQFTKWYTI